MMRPKLAAQGIGCLHLRVSRQHRLEADLAGGLPHTAIGYLARGLAQRQAPVTVLSLDNMPGNGERLQAAVARFAELAGLDLNWDRLAFPCTMVDRITPAPPTPDVVLTEPFREWVIEDRFAGSKPGWPGVEWVQDVAAYELRKLRMLNGAHSYLAYAGLLAEHSYVHEAVGDDALRQNVHRLMQEAAETLPADVAARAPAYAEVLMTRFDNPHLAHRLAQIAMDGSQKVAYRLVDVIAARQRGGVAAQGVRAWIDYCRAQQGRVDDPLQADIGQALRGEQPARDLLDLVGAGALAGLILE